MDIMVFLNWLGLILAVLGLVSVLISHMIILPGVTWFMIGVVLRMAVDVMGSSP